MEVHQDCLPARRATIKLLFLCDHLGHAGGGVHGASTYYLHVLPALQRAGVAVTACFLRGWHPLAERLEGDGVTPVFLDRGKWDLRALGDVIRLIRAHDVQVVHAAGMKGILLGKVAAKWTGAKCVIHLHDTNPLDPLTRMLQRITAGWAHRCIAISEAVGVYAREALGIKSKQIRVIYNPLPDSLIEQRKSTDFGGEVIKLAIVGRLAPEKGHASFFCAAADWLKSRPNLQLMVIGDGPLREELGSLIQSLGLNERVLFAGQRDDVQAFLRDARVLIIPSLREGLGYVALEAMAAGCPVAAYAVGGLSEIIEDGKNGLLAPAGDATVLLANIERILSDIALARCLVDGGWVRIKYFSLGSHVQQLQQLYDEARYSR